MATNYVDIVSEQLPAANTTIYTSPTVNSGHIVSATVFNESAANAAIIVNVVQNGGAVGVSNRYSSHTVPAGKGIVLYELINMVLNTGDYISAIAGTASALNLKVGIKELTT